MNSDRAVMLAIALVIAATAVGIYMENKGAKIETPADQFRRGRPLAN